MSNSQNIPPVNHGQRGVQTRETESGSEDDEAPAMREVERVLRARLVISSTEDYLVLNVYGDDDVTSWTAPEGFAGKCLFGAIGLLDRERPLAAATTDAFMCVDLTMMKLQDVSVPEAFLSYHLAHTLQRLTLIDVNVSSVDWNVVGLRCGVLQYLVIDMNTFDEYKTDGLLKCIRKSQEQSPALRELTLFNATSTAHRTLITIRKLRSLRRVLLTYSPRLRGVLGVDFVDVEMDRMTEEEVGEI
ncbi:hypothetical protein HDV00_008250 [Rhizophlyctis rosea]|nr:hypothetical protein HDV00_008250 [Rhizophlyctis rosea]